MRAEIVVISRRWGRAALLGILFAVPTASIAAPDAARGIGYCVDQASHDFRVPRVVILLILDAEAGWVGAASPNTNGSYDYGPMQVNSSWLPTFARFGITRDMLQNHACTNIYAGTWLLSKLMAEHTQIVDVIANYHSPTLKYQLQYLDLVRGKLVKRLIQMEQDKRFVAANR